MAETGNGNGHATVETAMAGSEVPTQLLINAQYVKDLSFENPNAPQSLTAGREAPQVEVGVNVNARAMSEAVFEVVLSINAKATRGGEVAFVAEVAYAGIFTLNGLPSEHVHPVLFIECPRLLFPFARSVLSDATRDGGFPPLMIQPIDFVELYRRQAEQAQKTAEGGAQA